MAFTQGEVALLKSVIDEAITNRRRSAAKSTRPQFKEVFDREVSELSVLKLAVDKVNDDKGPAKAGR